MDKENIKVIVSSVIKAVANKNEVGVHHNRYHGHTLNSATMLLSYLEKI